MGTHRQVLLQDLQDWLFVPVTAWVRQRERGQAQGKPRSYEGFSTPLLGWGIFHYHAGASTRALFMLLLACCIALLLAMGLLGQQ